MTSVQKNEEESTKKIAAVIDDAFDELTEGEAKIKPFLTFYESIEDSGELDQLLEKLNIAKPDDVRSWDDESEELLSFLRHLWTLKSEAEFLPIIRKFEVFQTRLEKLKDMFELIDALKQLSIDVEEFDSTNVDPEKFKDDRFSLVFYRL